jgi:hypothetical protein
MLSRLAHEMYSRQVRYMIERNPLISFTIPLPIQAGLELVTRRALRTGTRSLVSRFDRLGLALSPEMKPWA